MTPYEQLIIHDPARGVVSDCFRACIACLLDEDPHEVPHVFMDGCDLDIGLRRMRSHLRSLGLGYVELSIPLDVSPTEYGITGHYILTGKSLRQVEQSHCVIAQGAYNTVWDPHPMRQGLSGPLVGPSGKIYRVGTLARL